MTLSVQKKPAWLNKKISLRDCTAMKTILKERQLNTVCQEAQCPNIGECFANNQATFIIMGSVCTRGCRFCGIKKGSPSPLDENEPFRIADIVRELALKHIVITSVTRDDLIDGGAKAFVETINAVRRINQNVSIEVLIPDFQANIKSLEALIRANPDIIAHNLETVPRLYKGVRQGASYEMSLKVFKILKNISNISLKSGLMLGLGEKEDEVLEVFDDLLSVGCSYLSIGQYLAPSNAHVSVKEYILPEVFDNYRKVALKKGFCYVKSAPYVRSSYMAEDYLSSKENS
jgi:lipoic acid synthetase